MFEVWILICLTFAGNGQGCIPTSLPDDSDGFTTTTTTTTTTTEATTTEATTTSSTTPTTTTTPPPCDTVCPTIQFCRSADQSFGNCAIKIYSVVRDTNNVCTFSMDCSGDLMGNIYMWYKIVSGSDMKSPGPVMMDSYTCQQSNNFQWKSDTYGYTPLEQTWCAA